jgi:hypothetical protein
MSYTKDELLGLGSRNCTVGVPDDTKSSEVLFVLLKKVHMSLYQSRFQGMFLRSNNDKIIKIQLMKIFDEDTAFDTT